MAPIYLIIGLVIQGSLIYAETEETELPEGREILNVKPEDDEVIKDYKEAPKDWMDLLMLPDNKLYPTSAAAMMAQATDSGKPIEEQMEDIKEIANKISEAIESELANLLSYAIAATENEKKADETKERRRRSAESPLDSTQLVMRLLKHIKSTNEYQNIAIEKMMSAQEIADKFGIEFTPDTEILTDLAVAANEHAKELTEMLNEACDLNNKTCSRTDKVNLDKYDGTLLDNNTQYIYATHYLDDDYDDMPHPVYKAQSSHHAHYETQIPAPPVDHYCSQKPSFYDAVSYTPDYYSHCSVEPTTSMFSPLEEFEPEPELVAEEFEETTSNRFIVERGDEPGSATVNHIMTYSISEKSHFRTPQIERLPQQMQYYFYLI
ncbi:uncharacterized protein LOC115455527 [Manduca sexta]|uniref:uncharacterized protein LOC115455527 n=1 Tax=Manduca sexta TaxID=7130 RepID=UPI00188E1336|nr:uncharacterized protein LOC115455527 [Manduca sexta]